MKISNEVKVGAVALVTIIVFIWLFNFLKGKDFFKSTANYYSVYENVGGLAESSPIEINGFKVGVVQSIGLMKDNSGKILVKFSVSKDFKLPVNSYAEILPVSIIAGMKVQLVYGSGPGYYSFGDTIPGIFSASIMTTIGDELQPIKDKVLNLVTVLDSVITSINDIVDPGFRENLKGTMAHLDNTTGSLDRILGSKEKELKETLENITRFSDMLAANTGKLNNTLGNLETISDTLAAADLYSSISNLKASLEKASLLLGNLNDGKGSAGQFLSNDSLYINLNNSLGSLNLLLEDVKRNPKRYVHFSLFGKKNIPDK
jgi:phospholipid/cholesterol/gamma-HCH transport system substrate-binding protein